uniref:Nucleotid_trans domain-containing protein n=1 Tax=Steinernema glaseri TaxID=37863 RepID=A0A1I8ASS0_9BILA
MCHSSVVSVCDKVTHVAFVFTDPMAFRYDTIEIITPYGKKFVFVNEEECTCQSYVWNFCEELKDNELTKRTHFFLGNATSFLGLTDYGIEKDIQNTNDLLFDLQQRNGTLYAMSNAIKCTKSTKDMQCGDQKSRRNW